MNEWQPIETAPKNGEWVLLIGGRGYSGPVPPCVVAFFQDDGIGGEWLYCYWDGDWRSAYENPTHWSPMTGGGMSDG